MIQLTPQELAARKKRNLAIGGVLVAFVVLIFAATINKLQHNGTERSALIAAGKPVGYAH